MVRKGVPASVRRRSGSGSDERHATRPRLTRKRSPDIPASTPAARRRRRRRRRGGPLLYVQIKPRYSLYVDSEAEGHFVVDAGLSPYYGVALPDMVGAGAPRGSSAFSWWRARRMRARRRR